MSVFHLKVNEYFLVFSLIVSVVGPTGCEEERPPIQEEGTPPPISDASMRGYGSPSQKSLSPGDFDIENLADEMAKFDQKVASASNWKEAHQEVRDLLESSSSAPRFVREQAAAHAMFREYLNTDQWRKNFTEEKANVLGLYTQLLVENRSPESDLVYVGLQKLEGHWPKQRIASAAEKTLRAAKRKYGSSEESAVSQSVSSSEEADPNPELADSRERHAERVMESNRKLKAMVDSLKEEK